jgi:hypothetical protein
MSSTNEWRTAGSRAGLRVAIWIAALSIVAVLVMVGTRGLMLLSGVPWLLLGGALSGWIWGPYVLARGFWRTAVSVLGLASTATVVGAFAVAFSLWLEWTVANWHAPGAPSISLWFLPLIWLIGTLLLGLPSLLGTVPLAIIWRRIVLRTMGSSS